MLRALPSFPQLQHVSKAVEALFTEAIATLSEPEQEDLENALLARLWAQGVEKELDLGAQSHMDAAKQGKNSRAGDYFENKLIYNTKNGNRYRLYRPYRCLRFRSRGSFHSKHCGKPSATSS